MKRKTFVTILLLLASFGGFLWFNQEAIPERTSKKSPKPIEEQSPDAMREFFAGKAGPDGTIPFGLRRKWREHDQSVMASNKLSVLADPFSDVDELGPFTIGGRTRALLITHNNEKMWAGAASGGLWLSNDVGTTWNPVDDLAENLSVTCIDVNPFDDDIMYYGTGEPRGSYFTRLQGDGDGVFKSINGGLDWFACGLPAVPDDFANIWALKCSPVNANTVYVGCTKGLFRSLNGGLNWNQVESGVITDIVLFATGEVLVAKKDVGIFRSVNGNSGTFNLVGGVFSSLGRIAIEATTTNPDQVYAFYADSPSLTDSLLAFMVSFDRGNTWASRNLPPIQLGACQRDYNLMLGVRNNDPNHVVVGMQRGAVTYDGGITWQLLNIGHNDFHSFVDHPSVNNLFYVGTDGGVYEYEWLPGLPPFPRNQGYSVIQQWAGDHLESGDRVLASTQDNKTHKIVPAGVVPLQGPESSGAKVHDQDHDIAYYYDYTLNSRAILKYTDFNSLVPTQFQQINNDPNMNDDGLASILYFGVNEGDGDQLYVPSAINLWRSVDQGGNWDSLFTTATSGISRIGMTDDVNPTLYFGGSGVFFRLNNAQTAGVDQAVDISAGMPAGNLGSIKVNPDDEDVLYVSFRNVDLVNPRIYRVEGASGSSPTWTSIHGNLPASLPVNWVECDPDDPDNVLFAGTDFGLYYTSNGGVNWIKEERIPNVYVIQLSLRASDRTLFAYTHGRGSWKLKLYNDIALPPLSSYPEVADFEGSTTGWNNDYNDDINWYLYAGGPGPSGWNASPSGAYSGLNYWILGGKQPHGGKDKRGKLLSPEYDISGLTDPELSFYYYMNSPNMGSLKLAVSTDQGQTWNANVWSRSGDQGASWNKATVDLNPYTSTGSLLFRWNGKTGTGNNVGDMGLDLVTVDGVPVPKFGGGAFNGLDEEDLLIYPTVFRDHVNIRPPVSAENYQISLIDASGKVLIQKSNLAGEYCLDLPTIAAGSYWLKYRDAHSAKTQILIRK